MKLGYRCIIVKGQPADTNKRYALDITADGVNVISADEHKGKWNYKLIEDLTKTYSPKASFISIGPAGEMKLSGASVACTDHDQDRRPARHAGRGGLGAVMGSKCIKYMSVDASKRPSRKAENTKEFSAMSKKYTKDYQEGPAQEPFPKWGTSALVTEANNIYTFPYKNRVEGRSPDVDTLDGMRIVESFEERGGGMHNCMTGCIVKCSEHRPRQGRQVQDLGARVRDAHAARLRTVGSQTFDEVAELDRLCDEVGPRHHRDRRRNRDPTWIQVSMDWGDSEGCHRTCSREIAEGYRARQDVIGNGAVATGQVQAEAQARWNRGQGPGDAGLGSAPPQGRLV